MKKKYTKSSIIMSIAVIVAITYILGGASNMFVDNQANAQSVITPNSNQSSHVTAQNSNSTNMTSTNGNTTSKSITTNATTPIGTIPLSNTMSNAVFSKTKVNLSNAVSIAEKAVDNKSHAISARLGTDNGYLVYIIWIVDGNNSMHRLVVDPGNGKVLLNFDLQSGNRSMGGID